MTVQTLYRVNSRTFEYRGETVRAYFMISNHGADLVMPGHRIGQYEADHSDVWKRAEKEATRHMRRIHRGPERIVEKVYIPEIRRMAWIVRRA